MANFDNPFELDFRTYLIYVLFMFVDVDVDDLLNDDDFCLNDLEEYFIQETSQELFDSVTNLYHSHI